MNPGAGVVSLERGAELLLQKYSPVELYEHFGASLKVSSSSNPRVPSCLFDQRVEVFIKASILQSPRLESLSSSESRLKNKCVVQSPRLESLSNSESRLKNKYVVQSPRLESLSSSEWRLKNKSSVQSPRLESLSSSNLGLSIAIVIF